MSPRSQSSDKEMLHPRNRHRERYDFPALIKALPKLAGFVGPSGYGHDTIDFGNPDAVKALNQALLKLHYGVSDWNLPEGYLCPPIPGRADYVHHVADLLATSNKGSVPHGPSVRVLEIGVGASCVYPIIGRHEYGWSFVGTDIDKTALRNAEKIVARNPELMTAVELRLQTSPAKILAGVIGPEERFDLTMCNPPFHASFAEADAGTQRKLRALHGEAAADRPSNFAGRRHELWCRGGELGFVTRLIGESVPFARQCLWFTSLISKADHLNAVRRALTTVEAAEVQVIDMAQGQKKSRIVAWTFKKPNERQAWAAERFLLGRK